MNPNFINPLENLLGYRLRRTSADAMSELARDLGTLGLRPTEASALVLISVNNGMTQSDIGRILGIKRANMAPLASGLEKEGLITRLRMDGRSQNLVVTAEGADVAAKLHAAMRQHDQRLVKRLSDPERRSLAEALSAMSNRDSG